MQVYWRAIATKETFYPWLYLWPIERLAGKISLGSNVSHRQFKLLHLNLRHIFMSLKEIRLTEELHEEEKLTLCRVSIQKSDGKINWF